MLVLCFLCGVLVGRHGIIPAGIVPPGLSAYLLYLLVVQVGLGIGLSGNIRRLCGDLSLTTLLIPLGTIVGSLSFAALSALALGGIPMSDALSLGSGLGYYSLSSVIIIELKAPSVGMEAASALGALALLTNLLRELMALCLAPLFRGRRWRYCVIASAGVASADVLLPSVARYSGQEMVPAAIINTVALEIAVPLLVSFFCSVSF